jgi:hypothetical protein
LGFCFGIFFWFGRNLPHDTDPAKLISQAQTSSSSAGIQKPNNSDVLHAAIWRDFVEPEHAGLLFENIYQTGLRNFLKKQDLQNAIFSKFKKTHPTDVDIHHRPQLMNELVGRIGILKVLHENFRPEQARGNIEPLLQLYKEILFSTSEHWIVKRQALQNMAPWMAAISPAERDKILAAQDPRAIALASKSEKEILSEAMDTHAY